MIPSIFFAVLRAAALHSIVLSVWVGMAVPKTKDSEVIAWAISEAIVESPSDAVFGEDRTAAAMAYYSAAESNNHLDAASDLDAPAFGAWQEQGGAGKGSALTQAHAWLRLLAQGASICPASPAAPLSGGCSRAWKLANRRTRTAWRLANLDY